MRDDQYWFTLIAFGGTGDIIWPSRWLTIIIVLWSIGALFLTRRRTNG